jgi:hypothetical protein
LAWTCGFDAVLFLRVERKGDCEVSFRKWVMGKGKKANELADAIGKRSVIKDLSHPGFRGGCLV